MTAPARIDLPVSASVYVPLAHLAEAAGIDVYQFYHRFKPDHWGMPKHWRVVHDVHQVNVAFVSDLVHELLEAGEGGAAEKLRAWLEKFTAGRGTPEAEHQGMELSERTSAAATQEKKERWFSKGQYQ